MMDAGASPWHVRLTPFWESRCHPLSSHTWLLPGEGDRKESKFRDRCPEQRLMPHKEMQNSSVNSSHLRKVTQGFTQLPQHLPLALGLSHTVMLIN